MKFLRKLPIVRRPAMKLRLPNLTGSRRAIIVNIAVGLTMAISSPSVQAQELLGYWKLDETSVDDEAIDSSGNGLNGVYEGDVDPDVDGAPGFVGSGAFFPGVFEESQILIGGDETGLGELTGDFSIMAWMKPSQFDHKNRVFGSVPHAGAGWGWGTNGDQLEVTTWGVKDYTQPASLEVDEWVHAAITLNEDNVAFFYVNGELVGEQSHEAEGNPVEGSIFYLGWACCENENFEGFLDEVGLFQGVLTEEQINNAMTFGVDRFNGAAEPGPNVFVISRANLGQLDTGAQEIILAVSNVGTDNALAISGVTASGPDADRITIGDFPATIAPGAAAEIKYTLDPGRTGDFQFNIDIASDDVDEEDKNRTVAVTAAVINFAGPAAHYALDEADGATEMRDITGYGRHGTYDGVTLGQDALATGTAGGFGGGSFGEIPGASLQMTDFTVSMWANPSELADFQTLFGQGSGSPSFALLFTQTEVSWFFGDDIALSTETSPIAAGTPVHVAATYDSAGPTVTLFADGVEVARQEGAPELDLNDSEQAPFYIGAFAGGLPFSGTLDDVQVYNRVLNADNVKVLFDNPGEVDPPQPGGDDGPSRDITGVSKTAAGVSLSLPDGTTYDIEYSTDLQNWSNVATDVTGSYDDTDAGRTGNPAGFYRGVVK